jgi:hypothetical protein
LGNRYDIEFLIKDKKEIRKYSYKKSLISSPQALLDTMWRSERDRLKEKVETRFSPVSRDSWSQRS